MTEVAIEMWQSAADAFADRSQVSARLAETDEEMDDLHERLTTESPPRDAGRHRRPGHVAGPLLRTPRRPRGEPRPAHRGTRRGRALAHLRRLVVPWCALIRRWTLQRSPTRRRGSRRRWPCRARTSSSRSTVPESHAVTWGRTGTRGLVFVHAGAPMRTGGRTSRPASAMTSVWSRSTCPGTATVRTAPSTRSSAGPRRSWRPPRLAASVAHLSSSGTAWAASSPSRRPPGTQSS